jgi:hypothetical protein
MDGEPDLPFVTFRQQSQINVPPYKHQITLFARNPNTFQIPTPIWFPHFSS